MIPQKVKNRIAMWSNNSTSRYLKEYPKELKEVLQEMFVYHVHGSTTQEMPKNGINPNDHG